MEPPLLVFPATTGAPTVPSVFAMNAFLATILSAKHAQPVFLTVEHALLLQLVKLVLKVIIWLLAVLVLVVVNLPP